MFLLRVFNEDGGMICSSSVVRLIYVQNRGLWWRCRRLVEIKQTLKIHFPENNTATESTLIRRKTVEQLDVDILHQDQQEEQKRQFKYSIRLFHL